MKVWIFVEGDSDVKGLSALLNGWKQNLSAKGWGIQVIPLDSKSKYFRKIGSRATEKLANDPHDLVVGLPDLYPNQNYANTDYRHNNLQELQGVQTRLVERHLQRMGRHINSHMARFYPSALKHDLEMLLLAATSRLQFRLNMSNRPSGWRRPPEDQNQNEPPKKIVEGLFKTHLRRPYRETVDSHAILREVVDLREVVFDEHGTVQCPVFRAMIAWIGKKTGVPGY